MTDRTTTRLTSFALAALVTWTVFSGIDTLALEQYSSAMQMSQAAAPMHTAALTAAARS